LRQPVGGEDAAARLLVSRDVDFVQVAISISNALEADYFVAFAYENSKWTNDHKVTYENLCEYWSGTKTKLCQPFVTI
jgi:hypothetical protein